MNIKLLFYKVIKSFCFLSFYFVVEEDIKENYHNGKSCVQIEGDFDSINSFTSTFVFMYSKLFYRNHHHDGKHLGFI